MDSSASFCWIRGALQRGAREEEDRESSPVISGWGTARPVGTAAPWRPGGSATVGGYSPAPLPKLRPKAEACNVFLESRYAYGVREWTFLTNHARVLLCIARDPGVRLRDIAALLEITERSAFGIVTDLTDAGYVVKQKDGRRNRYQIQEHLPVPELAGRGRSIGELLTVLTGGVAESGSRA